MNRATLRVVHSTLTLALFALAGCSDEPTAISTMPPRKPHASVDDGNIWVTNKSGGTDVGSFRWAVAQAAFKFVKFDPSLAGDTIVVDTTVVLPMSVTIIGPTDKGITISGGDRWRVFDSPGYATFMNMGITRGRAFDEFGSAIHAIGRLVLDHATVWGNTGSAAAIVAEDVTLNNSTVSGNTGSILGSGIAYKFVLALFNATVAHNGPGAGIFGMSSAAQQLVILNNSIISNNGQQNCYNTVAFAVDGLNISNDATCPSSPRMLLADPLLGGLRNNGGPTMTESIGYLSPALNRGVSCVQPTDQRYVTRDAKCDVGAFEFTDFTRVTVTIDPNAKVDRATGKALLTGTIKCTRNDSFRLALELHQDQKVSGQVVDQHAASDIPIACTASAQPWSATMVLTDGAWQGGAARGTAQTFATPEWVAPASAASAVKISFSRK